MSGRTVTRLGDSCWCGRLTGGLPLYVLSKPGFRQKSALLAVGFGSMDQRVPAMAGEPALILPAGAAHFLEHRMFLKRQGDITERFAELGVEADANTTYTHTGYQCSGADHLDEALDLLLELVLEPYLSVPGVAREREIISREIELYGDNLEWVSYFRAVDALYPGHALATDIAGTVESVKRLDRAVLARCHRAFYHPGNMALFVCGDVEAEAVASVVDVGLRRRGIDPGGSGGHPTRPVRRLVRGGQPASRHAVLPVVLPHRSLAFADPRVGLRGRAMLARELALELALDILFGAASAFYCRRYAEGLVDSGSFGFEVNVEPWFSFSLVGGDSRWPDELQRAVLDELRRARRSGVIEAQFERARGKAYGHLVQGFDQVEAGVQLMHAAVSCGAHPFDLIAAHERLDAAQVRDALVTGLDPQCHGLVRIDPAPTEPIDRVDQ